MKLPSIHVDAPAAIAFSGGGDSTALLHACRDHSYIQHAFIIDHALRDDSAAEAMQAAEYARSLGYICEVKRWPHSGVKSGIQAKARDYRYAAMGDLCRANNLKILLTAHTQDDQAETLLMRLDRQTGWRGLAGMPTSAYAPIWPALAEVTLHRPWLDVSRADIRRYNSAHGLAFVDDPSNENRNFTRVRARQALAADGELRADLIAQQKSARQRLFDERKMQAVWFADHGHIHKQGFVETNAVPPPELLRHILNVVSGGAGPIHAAKLSRLCADMQSADFKAATLSGAWIVRQAKTARHSFVFLRDRVAVTGRGGVRKLPTSLLAAQSSRVWDGRFFCEIKKQDIRIKTAYGCFNMLREVAEFKSFFELPKEVRGSIPVFFHGGRPIGFGACENEYLSSRACAALRLQSLLSESNSVSN